MNAAERLLALKALKHGIDAAIAHAEANVEQMRIEHGSRSFQTQFGELVHAARKDTITFTEAGQLAWAKANAPHEIVPEHTVTVPESVRPSLAKTLEARCKHVGDGIVVDKGTGEILDFATHHPGTKYWSGKLTAEAKEQAADAVLSRLDTVTGLLAVES